MYFKRSLMLNREYLPAWTLMGHEFVELKNSHAAIEAYRKAIGRSDLISYRQNGSRPRCQCQGLQSVVWSWTGLRAARHAHVRHRVLQSGYCFEVCYNGACDDLAKALDPTIVECGQR